MSKLKVKIEVCIENKRYSDIQVDLKNFFNLKQTQKQDQQGSNYKRRPPYPE